MKQITQEEIAKQIADLINQNVRKLKTDDEKWKNHYDDVMRELEAEINVTEEVVLDYTVANLTFNNIEQEGYLRCLKTMVNRFRDWEE